MQKDIAMENAANDLPSPALASNADNAVGVTTDNAIEQTTFDDVALPLRWEFRQTTAAAVKVCVTVTASVASVYLKLECGPVRRVLHWNLRPNSPPYRLFLDLTVKAETASATLLVEESPAHDRMVR